MHWSKKTAIAQKALGLIGDNSVILIDGGTTCLELARFDSSRTEYDLFYVKFARRYGNAQQTQC